MPGHAYKINVGSVWVIRHRFLINDIFVFHTSLGCNGKRITDPFIIGRKTENSPQQRTVGSMSVVSFGERAIKGERYFFSLLPETFFLARSAIDTAPAVCELEGPIMLGPITSNTLIKDILLNSPVVFLQ